MNRRGFLGAILAAGMAPAIVHAANLMPLVVRPSGLIVPMSMREIIAYDINTDRMLARFDFLSGATLFGVTMEAPPRSAGMAAFASVRQEAERLLRKQLSVEGGAWSGVPPTPKNCVLHTPTDWYVCP